MGTLMYAGTSVEFDDRVLTHLQIVIVQKFRRGEAFLLSWLNHPSSGDGRASMWLTPAVPVFFSFNGSRVPALDNAWISRLSASADGPRGLVVTDAEGEPLHVLAPGHQPHTVATDRLEIARARR